MSDKELIECLASFYDCNFSTGNINFKKLSIAIEVEYDTLDRWYRNNKIPSQKGYGKLYMQTLLKAKELEKELQYYKDIDNSIQALREHQKNS